MVFFGMLIVDYIGKIKLLKYDKNKKIYPFLIQVLLFFHMVLFIVLLLPLMSNGYIEIHGLKSDVYFYVDSGSIPFMNISNGFKFYLKNILEMMLLLILLSEIVFFASPSVTPEEIEEFKERVMEKRRSEKLAKSSLKKKD